MHALLTDCYPKELRKCNGIKAYYVADCDEDTGCFAKQNEPLKLAARVRYEAWFLRCLT
jgi:hypothetical protein